MVKKWYYELENKFPDIKCREMIVMPNHFHCIIQNVGADLRVSPKYNPNTSQHGKIVQNDKNIGFGELDGINEMGDGNKSDKRDISGELGEHAGSPQRSGSPLHRVVQWFKTMTTNEYIRGVKNRGWRPFNGKLWQRNYWEHIIRNEKSYQNISEYIIKNPINWKSDKLFK